MSTCQEKIREADMIRSMLRQGYHLGEGGKAKLAAAAACQRKGKGRSMSKRRGSRKGSGKGIIFGLTGAGIVVAAITGVVAYVMGKKAGWKEQSLATNGLYFQRGR